MKPFAIFSTLLLFIGSMSMNATTADHSEGTTHNYNGYGNSFIFVEGGIEFSVFPDGQFDFYMPNYVPNVDLSINTPLVSISFNSGYDYSPYIQYDDFGAIIQIENVPIYYDYYGRITRAGNVNIYYNNFGRIARIGGLYIHYRNQVFSHYTGYINVYNRSYVYRPWHRYYRVPAPNYCIVSPRPYRQYYKPVRYTYHSPYRHNTRPNVSRNISRRNTAIATTHRRLTNRYQQAATPRRSSSQLSQQNSLPRRTNVVSNSGRPSNQEVIKRQNTITQTKNTTKYVTPNRRTVSKTTKTTSNNVNRSTVRNYNKTAIASRTIKSSTKTKRTRL